MEGIGNHHFVALDDGRHFDIEISTDPILMEYETTVYYDDGE